MNKILEDSQNFWDNKAYSDNRTDDAWTLLDYIKDKRDKNETLDSEYVYKEVNKIVKRGKLRIENLEIFALLQWKQTVLNDIEGYLQNNIPDNFKSLHDEDAKVEPEEINKDLLNQAKWMLSTIRKNHDTFSQLVCDMQKLKRNINKVDEVFNKTKLDCEQYFEHLKTKLEDNELIEPHSIFDIKVNFTDFIKTFEGMKLEHDAYVDSIIEKFEQTKVDILDFIDTYKDYGLA